MNLVELLKFLPLVAAGFLAYHLVFKQQLPGKGIVSILSYFLGVIIIFGVTALLITNFLADWTYNLVQEGSTEEWQKVIDAGENIIEQGFGIESTSSSQPPPAAPVNQGILPTITPHPNPGVPADSTGQPLIGPTTYTVVAGDTLFGISRKYNTTVDAIMRVNNLNSYIIQPGQVLSIPAPSK
jgi:LysM repeat protein